MRLFLLGLFLVLLFYSFNTVSCQSYTFVGGKLEPNYAVMDDTDIAEGPAARYGSMIWSMPRSELIYIYGGESNQGRFNDFWSLNITSRSWTLLSGNPHSSRRPVSHTVFGTQGVESTQAQPNDRSLAMTFYDKDLLQFYMYGGVDCQGRSVNQLWRWNVKTKQWAWLSGNASTSSGIFYRSGEHEQNYPPALAHQAWTFSPVKKVLYVFGGESEQGELRLKRKPIA